MPKYVPSFVDTSGFVKAMNDEAYRNQALALKKEDALNKHADNFLSSYTNKIRPIDIPKFHQLWSDWKSTGTAYMKKNRENVATEELTATSLTKDDKFSQLGAFVEKSISWKGKQAAAAKIFKDGSKIVDSEKYISAQDDFGTLTSDELDEKYGASDKFDLSQFDFKPEEVKIKALNDGIKSGIVNPVYNGIKKIPTFNPNNPSARTTVARTIKHDKLSATFDVPQVTLVLGPDPMDMFSSVMRSSNNPSARETYKYYHKTTMDGLQDQNPSVQQSSQAAVDKAMKMFKISDVKNITPEHLYASSLINEDMYGTVQVDDWSEVDDMLDRFAAMNKLKKDDLQMQKLRAEINKIQREDGITSLNKLLTVVGKSYSTGIFGQGDWGNHIAGVIKSVYPNLDLNQQTLNNMGVWKFQQNINMFPNWMRGQQGQQGQQPFYTPTNPFKTQ